MKDRGREREREEIMRQYLKYQSKYCPQSIDRWKSCGWWAILFLYYLLAWLLYEIIKWAIIQGAGRWCNAILIALCVCNNTDRMNDWLSPGQSSPVIQPQSYYVDK